MKKFLLIVLACLMAFSVVACSGTENNDAESVSPASQAEDTVVAFLDDFVDFEFDNLKNYVDDETTIPEEILQLDLASVMEQTIEDLPEEFSMYRADFEDVFGFVIDKFKKEFKYELKETVVNSDEECTVNVSFTIPDMDDVDFESIMADSFDENAMNEIALKLLTDGKISAESSEQDIMDAVMPEVVNAMKSVVEGIEIGTSVEEIEFVVTKFPDGKWLITSL